MSANLFTHWMIVRIRIVLLDISQYLVNLHLPTFSVLHLQQIGYFDWWITTLLMLSKTSYLKSDFFFMNQHQNSILFSNHFLPVEPTGPIQVIILNIYSSSNFRKTRSSHCCLQLLVICVCHYIHII